MEKTIDIKHDKPWYHGVKWHWAESFLNGGFSGLFNSHDDPVVYPQTRIGGGIATAWFEDISFEHAQLIAEAPETATERDNLKADAERLRDVFKHADDTDWNFLMDILNKAERHDQDAETQLWISVMQDLRSIIQGTSSCK